jgi:hypothetical protein
MFFADVTVLWVECKKKNSGGAPHFKCSLARTVLYITIGGAQQSAALTHQTVLVMVPLLALQIGHICDEMSSDSWPVKTGTIRCPETSVNNYHTTLRTCISRKSADLIADVVNLKCFEVTLEWLLHRFRNVISVTLLPSFIKININIFILGGSRKDKLLVCQT